jgi:hypothetical protein
MMNAGAGHSPIEIVLYLLRAIDDDTF